MAIMEVILKAVDNITPTLNQVKSQTGGATKFMSDNWLKVGAAAAAAGAGIEMFYKKQAPLLEGSRKLAESLNLTEKEVINLVTETSNATFSLEDVIGVMEKGRQQGIKSAEQLQEYADFWDLVSDATGESSVVMADSSSSLRAVGIVAGEEKDAIAALGFIQQETTGSINEFLTTLGRMGPDLREMGLDINDTAALLGAMEQELGLTARVAKAEFSTAVNTSEGDMEKLLETLGLSQEQFEKYRQKVSESGGVLEEFARINNETMFTSLDKIKHAFEEASLKVAPFVEKIADFAPVLMVVGPAMKGVATAGNLISKGLGQIPSMLSGIVSGFKTLGGLLVANPWVIAIMAIVAAIVLIYENWDKVVGLFKATWEVITGIFNTLKESIGGALKNIWETVQNVFGSILDFLVDFFKNLGSSIVNPFGFLVEQLSNIFPALKESVTAVFESLGNFMAEKMGWIVEKCLSVWDGFVDRLKGVWAGLTDALKGFVNIFVDAINWIIGTLNKLRIEIPKWVPKFGGEVFGFNIPKIPRLHDGGTFRSPIPGGEGLALLRDKETIRTPEQEKALQSGASIVISQGAIVINTQRLDDREINRVGDKLMDVIISKSRAYNLRFGR